jgi:hypothetical protein
MFEFIVGFAIVCIPLGLAVSIVGIIEMVKERKTKCQTSQKMK